MKDRYRKDGFRDPQQQPYRTNGRPQYGDGSAASSGTSRLFLAAGLLFLSAIVLAALIWIVYASCAGDREPTEIVPIAMSEQTASPLPSIEETAQTPSPSPSPSPSPAVTPSFGDVSVGDEILFGHYELDNDPYYEPEPIPWIVLDRQPGRILVLSKYALNSKAYQTYENERPNITWAQCELRDWLNHDFFSKAFDADEQSRILSETVPADVNPAHRNVDPGNDTEDRVFLLSAAEVLRYFPSPAARLCFPTEYARECGADTDDADGRCWWWLRSPGHSQTSAAIVSKFDGEIVTNYIGMDNVGIRPAMWIACADE